MTGAPATTGAPVAVFIADDEAPARERLKELLGDIADQLPSTVVGEAKNGLEVIERLPGSGARVLFLDIEMPGMRGLAVARHLAGRPDCPAIIFVTAHDRHAVEAFELNALDYLVKPVRAARLAAALAKAVAVTVPRKESPERTRESLERAAGGPRAQLPVSERSRILLVPVANILYLKAELKYVTLRTREREFLIEESLVGLEKEYAERFVRIHRNCLVARSAIRGFERLASADAEPHWEVLLDGLEERLPVSRRLWSTVRAIAEERGTATE